MSLRYNQTKDSKTQFLRWRIVYEDDTELWEVDPYKQIEHSFVEIDQSRIKYFDLIQPAKEQEDMEYHNTDIPVKNNDGNPSILTFKIYHKVIPAYFRLVLGDGKRLIFARRTQKSSGKKICLIPYQTKNAKGEIVQLNYSIPFPQAPGGMIILVGWQKTIANQNVQAINVLYPQGKIELIDRWSDDAIHKEPLPMTELAKETSLKRVVAEKERITNILEKRRLANRADLNKSKPT